MNRRAFLHAAGALAAGRAAAAPTHTNIVLITADNLGYGDLGCYGNTAVKTPNLDRLAREGVRHTAFYTASPTCTVSRACLLTGRYPQRHGLNHQLSTNENMFGVGLPQDEKLIPSYLRPRGYRTACIGKWNIGWANGSRPVDRGFDEFFGHRSGNMNYETHTYNMVPDLYRNNEPAYVRGYSTDLFADAARDFVRLNAANPFFLYLPFNAVHYPNPRDTPPGRETIWQVPARYLDQYGSPAGEKDQKKRYLAAVTALDDGVGRVLKQLDDEGLRERTLVLFYSDNGAFMMPDKGLEVATNKPLRSGGNTLWEGGIRVPMMARWPGRIPAGSACQEPVISLDLLPTILQAASAPVPNNRVIDGRDAAAVLAGKSKARHDALYFHYRGMSAIRAGRHKLIREAPEQPFQLFDLEADIGETKDLASARPEIARDLEKKFSAWLAQFRVSEPPPSAGRA